MTRPTYVYIVECSDGTYYTGTARDISARLTQHNRGTGAKYTRTRRPVMLRFVTVCDSLGAALRLEARIKKFSRARKTELTVLWAIQGGRVWTPKTAVWVLERKPA